MEVARKQATTAEKLLEAEFESLEKALQQTPVDQDTISQQFQDLCAEIENYFERQQIFIEHLIKNKKNDEYDAEEVKRKAVRKRKSTVLTAIAKLCGAPSSSSSSHVADATGYRVHLPKREMPKFSGDVRQWRSFWASFQEVDNDVSIPKIEKYNFLLQSMTAHSTARKVVESFPPADTSYELARDELMHRFGRKKTLIKVYVRDLLTLVVDNAKDKKGSNFVDVVTSLQSQILNLEQLGVTKDKFGELLYPIIESCIPVDVLNRYLDMPGAREELEDILDFLRNEVRRKEESARAQSAFAPAENDDKSQRGNGREKPATPTATGFMNANVKQQCGFCGFPHITADCRKAAFMTVEERKEALKKANVCFKCLKSGHFSFKCKINVKCDRCGKPHHPLTCSGGEIQTRLDQFHQNPYPPQWNAQPREAYHPQPPYVPPAVNQQKRNEVPPASWTYGPGPSAMADPVQHLVETRQPRLDMKNFVKKADVLVQTQRVFVHSAWGRRVIRVMHDPGSQSTYITLALAMELGLQPVGWEKVIHQTFGAVLSAEMEHPVVSVDVSGMEAPHNQRFTLQASVMKTLGKNVIAPPTGPWLRECQERGIRLTDIVGTAMDIDLIIGNDVSPYLKVGMKSILLPCGLVATECRLGWFLEAKIPGTEKKTSNKAMVCLNMQLTNKDVSDYWALEAIGIRDSEEDKTRAELEEAAMDHFKQTVRREADGRYKVHLPWIEGHPSIPDNRQLCYRRLEKTTKDLIRDGYLQKYDDIFRDWEAKRIIEKVPVLETPTSTVHYLGHRAVYKEGSTTPVRPVFNASGRLKNSPSLNDCLEKGPNLLEIIPAIMSRFRLDKIAVSADIAKAFLQLLVTEEHRDCLRFLWWEDPTERNSIVEYRHCRVVFGVSSSPFLLGAVVKDLLEKNKGKYPETVAILQNSFYVDNCVASLPSIEAAMKFKKEAEEMFQSAQMDLRGWEFGPSSDGKKVPILGMLWETGEDTLSLELGKMEQRLVSPLTKRTVLALANSLYDPLGLLCPFIITIKMIFKRICLDEQKFSWDTELPESYKKEVNYWKQQVPAVGKIKLPRIITVPGIDKSQWSLHVMCDASKDAFACCVFLRVETNPVSVQLVQAKARVTPAKVVTIPRAELLGCLIAARLYNQVKEDLGIPQVPVTFWSDSTTAVIWIKKTQSVWSPWVNRRVAEIRKLTNVSDWRHVPGELNSADFPSRGITMDKYLDLRWWEGPEWLRGPVSSFPSLQPEADEDEVDQEKRKCVVSNMAVSHVPCWLDKLEQIGDWHRILRAVAICISFVRRKFLQQPCEDINAEEIQRAENFVFKYIQRNMTIPAGLRIHKDEYGVQRVVTKLVHGEDSTNFSYPIILPGNHPLVRLLIQKEHSLASHGGVQYVMSILRERFWIINARRSVKAIVNKCAICRVHLAKRCRVIEAPLPLDRIITTHCFDVVGVDLAGPLILKNGEKVWIVLYTCAVYRAVHLELVSSLSTEAFLQTLRKFVARRGRPSTIYSDNGTNFQGCSNLFKSVDWDNVKRFAAVKRINWIFNVPTAAWWGGWWERLVGMMKQLLRRVLGSKSVYYAELEVLLFEVESVLNERPLTYISEDPSDLRPLTPSLFLKDLPVAFLPEADVTADKLRRNLKHVQRLREELRSRFRKEYLSQLVCNGKTKSCELKPGDVVLVEVDNKKRLEWPMGVISDVYVGRDGKCRTAKVRTTQGVVIRPFQRLFPLELRSDALPTVSPRTKTENKEETLLELEDEEELPVNLVMDAEPEPIITKFGRRVAKPDRLGI